MSKSRITIAFGETPATSSKINTLVSDYLTRGQLIFSSAGTQLVATSTNGQSAGANSTFHLGWYPYDPAKQVFDTLALVFNHETVNSGGAERTFNAHLQYSLDTGASWTDANPGHSLTAFPLVPPTITAAALLAGSTQAALRTVSLSSIGAAQWLGFRYSHEASVEIHTWVAFGFLYLASEPPF